MGRRYRHQLRESERIRMTLEMVLNILSEEKPKEEFGSLLKHLAKISSNHQTKKNGI
jgi:hypothetical protein